MKRKYLIPVALLLGFIFGFSVWGVLKPDTLMSDAERRKLAARPTVTVQALLNGTYMSKYETYVTDQFPLRDELRSVKAFAAFDVFRQKDVNKIFVSENTASKLEYPIDGQSVKNAQKKFRYLYEQYMKDENVNIYLSLIPDKNMYLAETDKDILTIDYDAFVSLLREDTDEYMQYVDIFDTLTAGDYYSTDSHWRQERLLKTASKLADALGVSIDKDYTEAELSKPFYGVYCGQSALPLKPDTIRYLESGTLSECRVFDYETNKYIDVYDLSKAEGKDMYELFLSGPKSLLRIENPNADNERRLIIFRDSYGSSLAPLLASGYSEIMLVDIRYLASPMLGSMMEFSNSDVLFLYSIPVLNNSVTLK